MHKVVVNFVGVIENKISFIGSNHGAQNILIFNSNALALASNSMNENLFLI